MGKITYEYVRNNTSYVTTFEVPDVQDATNVAESLNKLINILGLRNELATVKINKNQNPWHLPAFGKLHTHPRMEQYCKLLENHVIVDKADLEEAKKKLTKYERDEILRGPEPLDRMCVRQETFEKLIAILEFYGNEKLYNRNLVSETLDAKQGDSQVVQVRAEFSAALMKDTGEAARKILQEITNKK
jgi:hypothetical protein